MTEPLSWDQAIAKLTAPGEVFATIETEIDGHTRTVFQNTPPSLRAIFEGARARGDETFLVYEDERWSFADVMARADEIAHLLVDRYGVGHGDRVAIGMRNYPEWIASFAAITQVGAIAVCLNAWWTTDELAYGVEDSGAKALLVDIERAERAAPVLAKLGVRAAVVRPGDAPIPDGFDWLDEVLVKGAAPDPVEIAPDDDVMILYTSGTTGRPKGAVSTHRAVLSALMAFGCRAQVNPLMSPPAEPHPYPPSFILVVPLFHVTGLVPVMLSCFANGLKLVMMYKWIPSRALELIERERVTNFVGVPTMSWDLLECEDFASRDTSSLASVGGGGAPAPPELVTRIDKNFRRGRPGIGYGMTETNAYGPQNSGDDYVKRPRSTGRTVPTMQVKVADEQGNEVPRGEVGEIWFAGPNLIRGYWNKPEATAETIVDGWLRSGDLGRMDDEGFVYVEDRVKDMVLRGGENVYCAEVEAVIYQHPAVYEAAVFGLPHERLGEEVAVAVLPREGHELSAEDLQEHVRAQLAGFKVPSVVEIVSEQLPRNASGKILKRNIRDELAKRMGREG